MSVFMVNLRGCSERLIVRFASPTLGDLAQELQFSRFVVGELLEVDGEATDKGIVLPSNQITMIRERE